MRTARPTESRFGRLSPSCGPISSATFAMPCEHCCARRRLRRRSSPRSRLASAPTRPSSAPSTPFFSATRRSRIRTRLVEVYTSSGNNPYSSTSYPDYFDLRDSGTFASLAAYTAVSITMDASGQPEPLAGQLVSGNYFDVLGITLPLGRGFTPDEDRIGAPVRVAVISHALWRRVFNADRPRDRPDDPSQRQPVHADRGRAGSVRRSGAWPRHRRLGARRRSSPKWIRRPPPCGARAVTRRSSTSAGRED